MMAECAVAQYAVTGAAGFIGSHLVDTLLSRGHQVKGLDDLSTGRIDNLDPRCRLIMGDVSDPGSVREALDGVDGCFHLAAIASVQRANEAWLGTNRVNLAGTITVLDTARKLGGIPVVYASSAAVYGDLGTGIAHEDSLPAPLTAYGADKLGSELHARVAFLVHGVPTLGLRFFNVYGPRQDPSSSYSGVISIFARRIARGLPITIHGAGDQVRDFVHVGDVVEHLTSGMNHVTRRPGATVLNVCTGRGTSIKELARLLGEIERCKPQIMVSAPRPGDIRHSIGDPSLAISLLGVSATTELREGLETIAATREEKALVRAAAGH
jgi:UDP-glucose 4-epimerase